MLRSTTRFAAGLALCAVALVSAPAAAQDGPLAPDHPLYREILALERERNEAYARRDTAALARALADEYLHTNLRGGTTTKAQELAFYGDAGFSLGAGEVSGLQMRRYGEVVVVTGQNAWRDARYRGVDLSGDFRVTRVYVRRDGRWQVVASHASRIGG